MGKIDKWIPVINNVATIIISAFFIYLFILLIPLMDKIVDDNPELEITYEVREYGQNYECDIDFPRAEYFAWCKLFQDDIFLNQTIQKVLNARQQKNPG